MKALKVLSKTERVKRRWRAAQSVRRNRENGGSAVYAWEKVLLARSEADSAFTFSFDWREVAVES